ncbi:MAG: hypothetical protein H6627_00635 [Calditrichae bacterium]|nr:hypothetical protein [Calditrichia bacterium]
MSISYWSALVNSWNRMVKMLFRPFSINKWFILGFSAFLAHLLDFEDKKSSFDDTDLSDLDQIFNFPDEVKNWIDMNPDWFALIIAGIFALIIIGVVLTWLSSRGKFMFLDNIVNDHTLIKKPWHEFKQCANSLFFWRIGYGLVLIAVFGTFLSYTFIELRQMYHNYASDSDMIAAAIRMGVFFLLLLLFSAYISLFLEDFVIPLMYKSKSKIWIGWSRFLPLLSGNFITFILYGLFVIFLYIVVAIAVVTLSLLTCCIGLVFLIIPYINSVITLPITVLFRSLGPEFMQQFGPEYQIFDESVSNKSE